MNKAQEKWVTTKTGKLVKVEEKREFTEEQARLISFCIYTSWDELTVDEKIEADKILRKLSDILWEE